MRKIFCHTLSAWVSFYDGLDTEYCNDVYDYFSESTSVFICSRNLALFFSTAMHVSNRCLLLWMKAECGVFFLHMKVGA